MLTFAVGAVETAAAPPDSSSLFALLLPPDIFSIADVAAVNGCSKNLFRKCAHMCGEKAKEIIIYKVNVHHQITVTLFELVALFF